jgi:mono/diheme cytochrome c family protein
MNSAANQPVSNAPLDSDAKDPAVPVWLIIVMFLLLYCGAVYFDEHGGWFDAHVYAPYVSAENLRSYQVAGGPNVVDLGRSIYNRPTCVACHQANGLGQQGTFPPLAGSDWVNEKEPGRIISIVLKGFRGSGLKVNGKPFETGGTMTPFSYLTDDEIAAVLSYVRQEWGNHAPIVTPEQVHAVREKVQKTHPQDYFSPPEFEALSPVAE